MQHTNSIKRGEAPRWRHALIASRTLKRLRPLGAGADRHARRYRSAGVTISAGHRRRPGGRCKAFDDRGYGEIAVRGGILSRAAAARGATQAAIQIGMGFLEVADDLEIDALDLRQIDLLDVHETQELLDGPRHFAAALVARATALRHADLRPELLLVHAETSPDFPGIQHAIEEFHCNSASVKGFRYRLCYTIGIWLRVRGAISRATDRRRQN